MQSAYILHHVYRMYFHASPYTMQTVTEVKKLLFHNTEDIDNYIRLHVVAAHLISLRIEIVQIG